MLGKDNDKKDLKNLQKHKDQGMKEEIWCKTSLTHFLLSYSTFKSMKFLCMREEKCTKKSIVC